MTGAQQHYFPTGRPIEGGKSGTFTNRHFEEALRRLSVLQDWYDALATENISQALAADRFGVSMASLHRWRQAYLAGGFTALIPKFSNSGRRSKEQS